MEFLGSGKKEVRDLSNILYPWELKQEGVIVREAGKAKKYWTDSQSGGVETIYELFHGEKLKPIESEKRLIVVHCTVNIRCGPNLCSY